MKKHIGNKFRNQRKYAWAKKDERYLRLAELDAMLEGDFYDCLRYAFYQETTGGANGKGSYVYVWDRRPSFQFNLFNMIADQVARKLFGGRHAPTLVHPDQKIREKLDALKEECKLEAKMIEATHWGSVGSVCTVFQIVPFKDGGKAKSKVVVRNIRSKDCTPTFNNLDELSKLLVHYQVMGNDFLNADEPIKNDFEGKEIKGDDGYWMVMEFTAHKEIRYYPIPIDKWAPIDGRNESLVSLEETEHGLGFIPAHWHQFRSGKLKVYDGRCYWEPAVPNIIDLDYTVSQIGAGIRYNAVPQVVVKGSVINNEKDGALGRGASRFLQIQADIKEGDSEEKNADIYMLEAKGDGMRIGLEHWAALTLRIAFQQVCASMKDPNKVTTAMSGKGMEVLESEFLDLAQELRTVFGDEGYLKLLKKIAMACQIKNHALLGDITIEAIDALTLAWPPLSSIGMVEFQAMCAGLVALIEKEVIDAKEARDYTLAQIDVPVTSANKDYLVSVKSNMESEPELKSNEKQDSVDADEDEKKQIDALAQKVADVAVQRIADGPIDTHFEPQGVS